MRQIGGHSLDGTISKVKNVEVVSEDGMIGVLLLSGQTPIPLEFHAEDAKTLANELLAAIRQGRKTKAPKTKAPNPDHASRGAFLHVRRSDACRRSVWRERWEATRDAARSGLICRVGGSSGHAAPRLMGLTA